MTVSRLGSYERLLIELTSNDAKIPDWFDQETKDAITEAREVIEERIKDAEIELGT